MILKTKQASSSSSSNSESDDEMVVDQEYDYLEIEGLDRNSDDDNQWHEVEPKFSPSLIHNSLNSQKLQKLTQNIESIALTFLCSPFPDFRLKTKYFQFFC